MRAHKSRFQRLNEVQSRFWKDAYTSRQNLVIASPTGSGKTAAFELAILHETRVRSSIKVVYIAPLKALVKEMATKWKTMFTPLGLNVVEYTGDSNTESKQLRDSNIILSTPEKIDSATRRWNQLQQVLDKTSLLLLDEIHTIGENRGACLEGLVTRFMSMQEDAIRNNKRHGIAALRLLALSATIKNSNDIAQWLLAKEYTFDSSFRPVPLKMHVFGYKQTQNDFLFENMLSYKLPGILAQFSSGRPALIFCSTKKGCSSTAKILCDSMDDARSGMDRKRQACIHAGRQVQNKSLAEFLPYGIAIHTAGLSPLDRSLVVQLFLDDCITALCCTSTLSQGVNLPAHLVVIKGTRVYHQEDHCFVEQNPSMVLQMTGRAGRPQFDRFGVAVILTTQEQRDYYNKIVHGLRPIESQIGGALMEHLNAGIATRSIGSIDDATQWLRRTFYYTRKRNTLGDSDALECEVQNKVTSMIHQLRGGGYISDECSPLRLSKLMAQHYILFDSMEHMKTVTDAEDQNDLLYRICASPEFDTLSIRQGEKKLLNELNKNGELTYKIKGKAKTTQDKVFLLLQAKLVGSHIQQWALKSDMEVAFKIMRRILPCLNAVLSESSFLVAVAGAIILGRMIRQGQWEAPMGIVQQIKGIGKKHAEQLVQASINNLSDLASCSELRLQAILGHKSPYGHKLKQKLNQFPLLVTRIRILHQYQGILHLQVTAEQTKEHFSPATQSSNTLCTLLVALGGSIIYRTTIHLAIGVMHAEFDVDCPIQPGAKLSVLLLHETLFGVDASIDCIPVEGTKSTVTPDKPSNLDHPPKVTRKPYSKRKREASSFCVAQQELFPPVRVVQGETKAPYTQAPSHNIITNQPVSSSKRVPAPSEGSVDLTTLFRGIFD